MPRKSMYIAEAGIDTEQRSILNLQVDHSHIVVGCAGSGKSCLALLRINMLSKMTGSKPYYLVTVVRSLVEYLRQELRGNDMPGECVITHKEWVEGRITNWIGNRFHIPQEHRQVDRAPQYLLVDECQDLPIEDLRSMKTATQKHIFLYGDDEQQIMNFANRVPASIPQIEVELRLPKYILSSNYRLPKKVAKFAQEITANANLERHCRNADGDKPYVIMMPRQERIQNIIALSTQNHYDEVGVLFRTDEAVRQAYAQLLAAGQSVSARYSTDDGAYGYLDHETKFKVMNFHQAKGQQFEAVFICLEDNVQYETKLLYVGITRTYHALYVMYEQQLPNQLRDIPRALYRFSLGELDQPLVQV